MRSISDINAKSPNTAISLHPGDIALTLAGARAAGLSSHDKILDIGCGTCASLAAISDEFGITELYGIDQSTQAIEYARSVFPFFHLDTADARSLPFEDDTFDCVMLECVITLTDDAQAVLSEAIRVLRPGGRLIISTLTFTARDGSEHASSAQDPVIERLNGSIRSNHDGLVIPASLESFLLKRGLETILIEDRTFDLTQYVIDSIMEYGSLDARIHAETELTGCSVFSCDAGYDRTTTGYHLFVFRKPPLLSKSTPVDELVAERIGITSEEMTQSDIDTYQVEAMRRTIRYAKSHSVFYRESFRDIDPDSITCIEDISMLPSTSESDLAGNEWKFQCIPASDVDRIVTVPVLEKEALTSSYNDPETVHSIKKGSVTASTSGTAGKRKQISYSDEDQMRSIEFINRGFLTMGCTEGEKMLVFMSGTSQGSIGDLVVRAMAPLHMDVRVYGVVTDIEDAYRELMEFRPAVVEALPWHAAALARYGALKGNPEREFIRSVNLSADVVPDSIVARLEDLWGCTVHRHYGTTEMAIFGGVECAFHKGYHTRPCDILYEIPETDPDGYGELLITTLDRKAMPLIRYRTGDIARFTDAPCPCGCRIRRIEKFLGRKSSLIRLCDGSFYLSELADRLYRIPEVIDFDVTIRGSAEKAGEADPIKMELTVRTLTGGSISSSIVYDSIVDLAGIRSGLENKTLSIKIMIEETVRFPSGYNLKKKVIRED